MLSIALAALSFAVQDEDAPAPLRLGVYEATLSGAAGTAGLAFTPDGGLWVAESERDRVRLYVDGSATRELGAGQLSDPHGVALWAAGLYVVDTGHHRVVMFDERGAVANTFGGYGARAGELRAPQGIAVAGEALYVADTGNDRVQKLGLDGTPLAQVGGRGHGQGQFLRPIDVAVDDEGCVYVTDGGNHRVQKFDAELRFVKSWGDFGPHAGFFAQPCGVEWLDGALYVVDNDNHRVQVFDRDGARLYEWGLHALLPREGEGKLHYPGALAVRADRAAVAEPFEDRVQLFRRNRADEEVLENKPADRVVSAHYGARISVAGDLLALSEPSAPSLVLYDVEHEVVPWEPILITRLALWGRKPGQLLAPGDVELDWERKLLFVADADAGTLSCWRVAHDERRPLGFDFFLLEFVRSIDFAKLHELGFVGTLQPIQPDAIELSPGGSVLLLDSLQRRLYSVSPDLQKVEPLAAELGPRPVDLALGPAGRIYVADELDGTVSICGQPPQATRSFGSRGEGAGQFLRLAGIAVAGDGSVYASDSALHRVTKFDADGRLLATWGREGLGPVEFHKPRGLDVDAQGRLWIVDWGNHRGQVLAPDGSFLTAFGSRPFTRPAFGKK